MAENNNYYNTPTGIQPTQDLKEWKEDDYKRNLQWLSNQYNRPIFNYPLGTNTPSRPSPTQNYVDNYLLNEAFYYGVQNITDFQSLTIDESNKPLSISLRKDRDIFQLINTVQGTAIQPLKQLPKMISAFSKNPNVISKKMLMKDLAKLKLNESYFMQMMEELSGYQFMPLGDLDLQDEAAIETYFTNYKEGLEIAYTNLARSICYDNKYIDVFSKAALHLGIGGLAMIRVDVQDGYVTWKIIPNQFAIWDNYNSDPLHRHDRFAGEVEQLTVTELLSKYEWSEQEKQELQSMAQSPENWNMYNSTYNGVNFQWYNTQSNSIPMISVVKGQWRSLHYEESSEIPYEVIREGILIGNKWVKNYGIAKNCPEDSRSPFHLRMRYIAVSPNMLSGGNLSLVDLIRPLQDEKNALKTKMFQLIAASKGKRHIVYADRLPTGMNTPEFLSQLTQAGVVVMEGTKMDDTSSDRNERIVDVVDMTLDPTVLGLANLLSLWKNTMNDVLAFNPTSLGAVSSYMSKDQLQQNIGSSKLGMEWWYSAYYEFVKNVLEVSADMAKLAISDGDKDYTLEIGDNMVALLKEEDAKKMTFEQFGLVLSIDDYLSEQERQFYRQYFTQKASASQDPMDDMIVINLERFTSKTELINYVQYITAEKIKRQQEMMEQRQMQQQQMADAAAQAQVDSASIASDASLEREAMKTERDLMLKGQPDELG
jgi:hypothetical protein